MRKLEELNSATARRDARQSKNNNSKVHELAKGGSGHTPSNNFGDLSSIYSNRKQDSSNVPVPLPIIKSEVNKSKVR